MDYRGEVVKFASFLQVSCTRYLSQRRMQSSELSVVGERVEQGRARLTGPYGQITKKPCVPSRPNCATSPYSQSR